MRGGCKSMDTFSTLEELINAGVSSGDGGVSAEDIAAYRAAREVRHSVPGFMTWLWPWYFGVYALCSFRFQFLG